MMGIVIITFEACNPKECMLLTEIVASVKEDRYIGLEGIWLLPNAISHTARMLWISPPYTTCSPAL
jgi:hypothetical protein